MDCEIATLPFSDFNVLENLLIKKADIIHLHWVAGMLDYPSFFKYVNKPVVWTLHDMNPFCGLFHYEADEIRNREIAMGLDASIKKIKKRAIGKRQSPVTIVTPSSWLLNEAMNSEIFNDVPALCIPNAVDTNVFAPKSGINFRSSNGIPEQNVILLFVAQAVTHYRKGFDLLLEALKAVQYLPITLLVLGNATPLSIDGIDIKYCGSINDDNQLARYYSNADAFIIPSREDNLPNVMLESFACGTPVIGFPVGGIKEHVHDYKTGLLAKEISNEALAATITEFCTNKGRFSASEIRNYAEKYFAEEVVAKQYIEVYQKILTG